VEKKKTIQIHEASLELLADVGIAFHGKEAVRLFRSRGFKTDGNIIFFTEREIGKALEKVPAEFTLRARDPEFDFTIGVGHAPALAPGYGAPFIQENNGRRRKATIGDYRFFCKLVQTSSAVSVNGFMMGDPADIPPGTYHLDMLLNSICLCSKPFMGSPLSRQAALDALGMAKIVFGSSLDRPVMISGVNALAPLQFASEMSEALMVFARAGQPVIITGGGIMGSTVPIRPVDLIVSQNAAVLAGICLAQMVNPGTPVIYGAGGSPMDMTSGGIYQGGPETNQIVREGISMANFYGIPSRGGGGLTDAHEADFQAGYQSALNLKTAFDAGAGFILHACGILGTYMAMSFEKFLADEEICLQLMKASRSIEFDDDRIDVTVSRDIGPGGQFLTHPSTFQRCRTEFLPLPIANRMPYDKWKQQPVTSYRDKAEHAVSERLKKYQKPDISPTLENDLKAFVASRKQ